MATRKTGDATGAEIDVTNVPKYSDDELLSVQSFEDAYALAVQYYGEENLVSADETIGNGFRLLADKDTLIDVSHSEEIFKRAIAPKQFVRFPHSGHSDVTQSDLDLFIKTVSAFLEGLP